MTVKHIFISLLIGFSGFCSIHAAQPNKSDSSNAEDLLRKADAVQRDLEQLGTSESAVAEAFELIGQYDEMDGPLFMNDATRKGLPRKPKAGLELDYAMFAIQQGLLDYTYTPENVKKFRRTLDGKKFESSSYFPGAVEPPKDLSEVVQVRINASQPTAWGSPVSGRENPARRPTGCYLAPGSIGILRVPDALINKGYSVRVGAHSWDLNKKPLIKRLDRVLLVYPIAERDTLIANPLGGGIYIEVPYEADAGLVSVAFKNVVRAPFFSARSFDKTTFSEWKKTERNNPAPWADFESDKFMMQVPSAWIRDLDDPETLMADWDKAMDAVSELFGYPLVRSKTVLYLQVDVSMRGNANFPGYPQSNYPYNAHNPEQCRHAWMIKGPQYVNWTVFHEVGHSQFFSKFRGEVEAVVNLPHVAVMNRKFGWSLDEAYGSSVNDMKHLTLDEVAVMWMVTDNFQQGSEMNHSNRPGDEFKYQHRGFGKYVEIANLFGWDALGRFWQMDNELYEPGDKVPQNNDPVDDRILRLSVASGADLTPLVHFWGIQPENPKALAKAIRKAGLKPSPEIFQRLEQYKTLIPMNNAEFVAHSKRVYPGGLKNAQNPLYGTGWYKAQLNEYDESNGQAAQAALQEIIDLYFPEEIE
ncbi:M60 family metallopeptidase [Pontiellaceae bacterium B12219]|nr:M60 family metallopeptidase [Pontiellaceae bacterium B12219]